MASFHCLKPLLFFALIVVFLSHVHASTDDEGDISPSSHSLPPSSHSPNGTTQDLTALQKHVGFFDRNNDGIIYPSETYKGFRAIGASVATSLEVSALIHGFLGPKTKPGKGIEANALLLPIYIENIKNGKRASDSGAYDSEGRFVEAKFEEIFTKHAKKDPNSLTKDELNEMLKAIEEPGDKNGASASKSEWRFLYKFFKDKDGLLQKDTVREVYDGSLFYNKQNELGSSL